MHKPINILYVCPCGGIGGAAISFLQLLKNLDLSMYKPIVVTSSPPDEAFVSEIKKLHIPVFFLYLESWRKRKRIGVWEKSTKYLDWHRRTAFRVSTIVEMIRLIKRYNVRIVHTNTATIFEGAIAAKLAGIHHIWHIRERLSKNGEFSFSCGLKRVIQLITSLSTRVITNSIFVKEPFIKYGDINKTVTIYNGIDLRKFLSSENHNGSTLRREYNINRKTPLIATIGYVSPIKRLEDFIESAAKVRSVFPESKFLIVGRTKTKYITYYSQLKKLISALNLDEVVIFTGFRNDIVNILDEIDVLAHTAVIEGFGRTIIEAMAAEKPVVGVKAGGVSETIVHGETGFLAKPKDPKSLADAIVTILGSSEKARIMGKAGRRRVEQLFTDEIYASKIQEIYNDILSQA